jgi:hypothetical protein
MDSERNSGSEWTNAANIGKSGLRTEETTRTSEETGISGDGVIATKIKTRAKKARYSWSKTMRDYVKLMAAIVAIAFAIPLFAQDPIANLKAPSESQIWGDSQPDNQPDPRPADNSALKLIEKINDRIDLIQEVNDRQDSRLSSLESRLADLESRYSRSDSNSYSGGNGSTGTSVTRVYQAPTVTRVTAPNMVLVNGQWVSRGLVTGQIINQPAPAVVVRSVQPVLSRTVETCPGGQCNASRTVTRSYTPRFAPRWR